MSKTPHTADRLAAIQKRLDALNTTWDTCDVRINDLRALLAIAKAAQELLGSAGITLDDKRLDYLCIQVDRSSFSDLLTALAQLDKDPA